MITKNLLLYLLLIILPDLYIYRRFVARRHIARWKKLLWWLPCLLMLWLTYQMATTDQFIPDDNRLLFIYLLLLGVCVVSKAVFALCSIVGRGVARLFHSHKNWGNIVGLFGALGTVYVTVYGLTAGFASLEVTHHDFTSPAVPRSFDGYRIAVLSDLHVGSYQGDKQYILQNVLDTLRSLDADMVCFVGDLQNMNPSEVEEHRHLLNSIPSRDGVFSVLGNHDYGMYASPHKKVQDSLTHKMIDVQRQMGWTLLLNENRVVRRGNDSIFVAGMENQGNKARMPQRARPDLAMKGIPKGAFTIMLEHDPTSWHSMILPETTAQLTFSGHTHGGQLALFGIKAGDLMYSENDGWYEEQGRSLYVSHGVGGLLPLRFGLPGEVALITLHHKTTSEQ